MMPWGHFFVAAIPFSIYVLIRYRRLPSGTTILALLLGTQFPDLIDKPLAWQFDVLINGRMFMHSLVFAIPLSIGILALAWNYDYLPLGGAFVFGHLTHIPGDFYGAFVGESTYFPTNMLWPLLPPRPLSKPEFVGDPSLIIFSTTDIVMIGIGTLLILYGLISAANSAQRASLS